MALTILLADTDVNQLESLSKYLIDESFTIDTATSGKEVQAKVAENEYFALLINYSIKNHSALQVLKFVKSKALNLKTFLIVEAEDAGNDEFSEDPFKKLGVTNFFYKPFEKQDILDVIEGNQSIVDLMGQAKNKKKSDEEENLESKDFTEIPIDEFFSAKAVLFDVYIKIKEEKYLKILHAGDSFEQERINKYKDEKNVEFLYFRKKDRMKYIKFNNYLVSNVVSNPKLPADKKSKIIRSTTDKLIELIYSDGIKPQILEQSKDVCKNVQKMIESHQDIYKLLKDFELFDPEAYSHAYLVSLFTTSLVTKLDWKSDSMLEMMSLASLFHDIGKMKFTKEMLDKELKDYTPEEMEIYYEHPKYACEMITSKDPVNNNVKQMILQHHEAFDGSGFPSKLKGSKLMVMANAIRLVDDFVHIVKDQEITPVEALKTIITNKDEVRKYHSTLIEGFIKVFSNPDKIKKETSLPSNSKIVKKRAV